jgi:signal transduction histidine kinase
MRARAVRVALALATAVALSAIAWPLYGADAFLTSLAILAPLGAATTLAADRIAGHGRRRQGLRRQLGGLGLLATVQLAVAVALFAELMFVSAHDAFFMALAAGYAAAIALGTARLLARRALADLDAVQAALGEVAAGARDVHLDVRGSDELAGLATAVEAMVAKIAAEESARRELVASVSHDLRTPITTLRLITEGLEDGIFEPSRVREQLGLISTHVRALGTLIDDLFELSRLQAADVHWSISQVHLDHLVHETIEAMRPHAEAGRVDVRAELDAELAPARGNPEQLQRVLFNLIQNAIRHTPADGTVVVRAARTAGPTLEVEVADSGAGIEPALRELVFEPFTQGPSRVAGKAGSAGLGLAITRAIVTAHGGDIWVADAGPGTRIRFRLPVY